MHGWQETCLGQAMNTILHQYLTANLETLASLKEPVATWLAKDVADIEGRSSASS